MKCKFLLMALFSISCVTSPMNSENKPGFTDLSQEVQSPLRGYWSFIVSAQVLILGEIHDNPEHHRIQAAIIRELAEQGRLDAILWEHIDSDQASLLQELTPETVDLIPEKLRWKTSGWPDFTIYRPVFLEALRTKVPQLAANFSNSKLKPLYEKGFEAVISRQDAELSGLTTDLEQTSYQILRKVIFDGHCQLIPEAHIDSMIKIQRARDAFMALSYRQSPQQGTTVYLVGSGHARKDFGIPSYLRKLNPSLRIVSVGLQEETSTSGDKATDVYDLSLVTSTPSREDPCESLRKHLKKS